MIAILYESTETAFTSNGLGGLPDCYDDNVHEKRNGEYELSFKYKVSGRNFNRISDDRIIYVPNAPAKKRQPFRIYRIKTSADKSYITVSARHISYDLSFIPTGLFSATDASQAFENFKSKSLIANPFTFTTDITTVSNFSTTEPTSVRNWLGGRAGSILDVYGGEYEWDGYNVILHKKRGTDTGITIRYGKNLVSLEQDRQIDAVYTGTIAYWIDSQTKKTVLGNISYIDNHASYPHEKIFPYDASQKFKEEPTADELTSIASKYNFTNDIGQPTVSIDVNYQALDQTDEYKDITNLERVYLCDNISVKYDKLNVVSTGKIIETYYSWSKEKYTDLVIGDYKSSFGSAVTKTVSNSVIPETVGFIQYAVDFATNLLTGGTGGHVIIGRNADGQPNEIYICDTDSIATATNILRLNYQGIGFSNDGGKSYNTLWTIDGSFNAIAITAGILQGITIKGCRIEAGQLSEDAKSEITGTVEKKISDLNQYFFADSTGAHVKTAEGSESVTKADGLHVMHDGIEIARFTANDTHVDNLSVATFAKMGSHRIETASDYEYGASEKTDFTAFYWTGDVK